jgi:hypothetical protein
MIFDNIVTAAFEKGDLHMSKLKREKKFLWIFLQKNAKGLFYHWIDISECEEKLFYVTEFFPSPESLRGLGADLLWTKYSFFFFSNADYSFSLNLSTYTQVLYTVHKLLGTEEVRAKKNNALHHHLILLMLNTLKKY